MGLARLVVMYGHIDGAQGKFARDPSGYLAIEAGIFRRRGLQVSWQHVQGAEQRYQKLADGSAQISLVVGRGALQHFFESRTTRILGSSMNTCPYCLMVSPAIKEIRDLKGRMLACRESVARAAPLEQVFHENGLGKDVALELPESDQDALHLLTTGGVQAALLPRPFGLIAEEKGFKKISAWPEVVDDPLPVMIETTASLLRERQNDFSLLLEAYREGIRYLKANLDATIRMLGTTFGHSTSVAVKTFDDYLVYLDDRLTIDFRDLENLLAQVAPNMLPGARQLASQWFCPDVLRV
jgi:ABC-type nitrate/sulfonate/bicarbonate transport system substrate-binding protein